MAKRRRKQKVTRSDLDLNKDGVIDAKDKSLAASVLSTDFDKVEDDKPVEEPKVASGDRIAAKDINLKIRKGDVVPAAVVADLESRGITDKLNGFYNVE